MARTRIQNPERQAPLPIVIDDREGPSGLASLLATRWPDVQVGRLPAGDVEIGSRILVERKTIRDFVATLSEGRLFKQMDRLTSLCERPLLIVEGLHTWPAADVEAGSLRGVLVTLALGFRVPMIRTADVSETANLLAQAAVQESRRISRAPARSRAPNPRRVSLDVLGMIPNIGDERSRRLLSRFGSVQSVLNATPQDLLDVEGIGPSSTASIRRLGKSSTSEPTNSDEQQS